MISDPSSESRADLPDNEAWGQTLRVRPSLAGRWVGMSPAWAALAGALSVGFTWTAPHAVALLTIIVLVEALYDALGAALLWTRPPRAPIARGEQPTAWFAWLPYSAPGSPSGRLASTWAWWRDRWRASDLTGPDGAFARMTVACLIAGVLAAHLGLPALVASLSVALLGLVRFILAPRHSAFGRWLDAATAALIPWILAGAQFGALSPASIGTGALYALVRGALIDRGRLETTIWAPLVADIAQLVAAILLIVAKQPLPATVLIIGLSAQVLLQLGPRAVEPARRMARVQLLVVAGMLLAGWAWGQ